MPWISDDQAAAEVSTWKVNFIKLKPALVTRKALWSDYEKKNSGLAASICEMGLEAATAALTGRGAFDALSWVKDIVIDHTKGEMVDKALEGGIGRIAGAHLTDFKEDEGSYKLEADKKFATKLASGFLTILLAAAGGTLTAVTGGSAAIVTAIAIVVWIGDRKAAAQEKLWGDVVKSMEEKYNALREKKSKEVNEKHRNELERNVMSNAWQDLEDNRLVKTYVWKSGNHRNEARYSTPNLKQLLDEMIRIDSKLGKELWIIDLLEVARLYSEEARGFWATKDIETKIQKIAPPAKKFDEVKVKEFMRRQIDTHARFGEVPTTKPELKLEELRKDALSAYGAVETVEKSQPIIAVPKIGSGTFKGGNRSAKL